MKADTQYVGEGVLNGFEIHQQGLPGQAEI
jgi:hypothetical protein